jgi:hypothetical protein
MWDTNPWAQWGLIFVTRDGLPVITETGLWHLLAKHPQAVERVSDDEFWLHLERPYHASRVPDRAFFRLTPAPFRKRAA